MILYGKSQRHQDIYFLNQAPLRTHEMIKFFVHMDSEAEFIEDVNIRGSIF